MDWVMSSFLVSHALEVCEINVVEPTASDPPVGYSSTWNNWIWSQKLTVVQVSGHTTAKCNCKT